MKAFISGISGFVGAGLARHLLAEGVEVHGMVRGSSNLWRLEDIKNDIHLHIGDLLNKDSVTRAIKTTKPDVIFHLAVYGAYPTQKDADLILSTSLLSTLHLLNAAKEAGVGMVVNTGSSSEYGTKDHPMREDELIEPNSYYAVGKAAQTLLCQQFARQEKLPIVTLRLFSVYGPYEEPGRLVPTVIQHALAGKDVPVADPRIARDFIYLEDVVVAYSLAAKKPELSGEVFNLGTGTQRTLLELVDAIIAITDSRAKPAVGAYEKRSFDTYTWVGDMKKTGSLLGFTPRYTFQEGLVKSVAWFTEHGAYYNK
jgi:nucleoside-diphosphate-sugar epimerase